MAAETRKIMARLEILAPAGGEESVYPAVRTGADAIYIGASRFSARTSAHNFDNEQLERVVRYCHRCGTAVHLACNTLVHDDEINAAMKAASNDSYGYTEELLVSSDVIGMTYGSLFDATQTMVTEIGDGLYQVQVVSWYDNENSYTSQMVRTIKYFAELG